MISNLNAGLRCHDLHAALRNIDANSAASAQVANTRLIGMAADLASLVRGQDVIADAEALRVIASDQLDINSFAFPDTVRILERADMIDVQRRRGAVVSFTERVPYYKNLYELLGRAWRDEKPRQLDEELITLTDALATAPVPAEDLENALGLDRSDIPRLINMGEASSLIQSVTLLDGVVLYSPFFGFENPQELAALLEAQGSGQFAEELEQVKRHQGLPIDETTYPAISDAISRGLVTAPSVQTPKGVEQPFATVPYLPDQSLFKVRKPVLDKALAVLACVRCGEHFGGATSTRSPVAVLDALLDPNRDYTLGAHSSHSRQYRLLNRMQIVQFIPSGNWVRPRLIVTEDNVEAVKLARELLAHGEPMEHRTDDAAALELLGQSEPYLAPIQTVGRRREKRTLNDSEYAALFDAAMGRAAL